MCCRSRENNKNKVGPIIWDTLYIIFSDNPWSLAVIFCNHLELPLLVKADYIIRKQPLKPCILKYALQFHKSDLVRSSGGVDQWCCICISTSYYLHSRSLHSLDILSQLLVVCAHLAAESAGEPFFVASLLRRLRGHGGRGGRLHHGRALPHNFGGKPPGRSFSFSR